METAELIDVLREWFAQWEATWRKMSASATLRLLESEEFAKAAVHLETSRILCGITVWGLGTLELIAIDRETSKEIITALEYTSPVDLRTKLDQCAREFIRLTAIA